MRIRPTSVTVIGWFLVVTALCSLTSDIRGLVRPRVSAVAAKSPVPIPVQEAVSWLSTVMNFVCGYFLLKGRNCARYTQIVWSFAMFAYGYFTSPLPWMLVIGLAFECLMIYLLFRPAANAFFAAENAEQPIANEMSKRQIASVGCYILAGVSLVGFMISALLTPLQQSSFMWLLVLPFLLIFPGIMILVGKLLSPDPNWAREIGVVLLASAACAVVFQIWLAVFFSNAEFQKLLAPGKPVPELNPTSAAIAVAAVAAVGGLLWWSRSPTSRIERRATRR